MIQIQDLFKTFKLSKKQIKEKGPAFTGKSVDAVGGISFECQPGRIYALLGPNGAGKTTTLRMIATIFKPTSGSISVNGIQVTEDPQAVRENIGFLTGSTGLYERLTPNELIKYFAKLYDVSGPEYEQRKAYLFDLLGINEYANKRIGKLSTGMRQKVSIARTVIHDPPVVIFDEPTSGLDVIASKAIIQLIRDCKDEGKTVIFSTHIMHEVNLLADDLGIIHAGKMVSNGTYSDFKASMKEDSLVDEFIRLVNHAS